MTATHRYVLPLILFAASCGSEPAGGDGPAPSTEVRSTLARNQSPNATPADLKALVEGNHRLTYDLFSTTAQEGENFTVSTLSIRTAFALVYAGAKGQTETEMADVLYFDPNQSAFHDAMNALDLALASRAMAADPAQSLEAVELSQANAFWGQVGYPWESAYLDTLAINYGAGIEALDFQESPEPSRLTINDWVEGRTKDRIKDLLPAGSIKPDTVAVLTNALYFKAPWAAPFERSLTGPDSFGLEGGSSVSVDFMRGMEDMSYATGSGWTAVEIPFRGRELSMVFIVPDAQTFGSFEQALDASTLTSIVAALQPGLVELALPKFEFETSFTLKQALKDLGMPTPFSADADLSGMMSRGGLFIDEAFHKTFVAIDEKGAEAAAATAIVVGETSLPVPDLQLKIDRPFFFMIRDRLTDTWLFFGRVLDPS